MIYIIDKQQDHSVDLNQLKQDVETILNLLDYKDFDITVLLLTNDEMHHYNKTFRNKDKPTDILSFPFHTTLKAGERIQATEEDEKSLGDILIAPQYVHDDLERWRVSFEQRIKELVVHGILHLLGYDHIEDEDYEVMNKQEKWLLERLS